MVAYWRCWLTRGGRTWRFNCIIIIIIVIIIIIIIIIIIQCTWETWGPGLAAPEAEYSASLTAFAVVCSLLKWKRVLIYNTSFDLTQGNKQRTNCPLLLNFYAQRCKLFTFGFSEAKELSHILVIYSLFLNNIKKKRNLFLISNFFIFLDIFSSWISCLYLFWFQFNFSRCIYLPYKLFSVCFHQRGEAFSSLSFW